MKVYVLGAGASKGSQVNRPAGHPDHAPLVDELFSPQYAQWAQESHLSADDLGRLRTDSAGAVESWLTTEWVKIETLRQELSKRARRVDFARITFYLWRLFLAVSSSYAELNAYRAFAHKLRLRDESFGLISFNYDTLLDLALQEAFGTALNRIDEYDRLSYIKPHGSVNWFLVKRDDDPSAREAEHGIDYGKRIRMACEHMFNGTPIPLGRIVMLRPDARSLAEGLNSLVPVFGGEYFFPLILLPLTSKMYAFVEGLMDSVVGRSRSIFGAASEIFLVGYRAKDDLIHDLLPAAHDGTKLHVVVSVLRE